MKRLLFICYQIVIHGLAVIGFVFASVFIAVNLKLTDVSGTVDSENDVFSQQAENLTSNSNLDLTATISAQESIVINSASPSGDLVSIAAQIEELNLKKNQKIAQLCQLSVNSKRAPKNILKIINTKKMSGSLRLTNQMLFALRTRLTDLESMDSEIAVCQKDYDLLQLTENAIATSSAASSLPDAFNWANTNEWQNAKTSILKDQEKIVKAARVAKISPRIIVSSLMVEQLRLYFSQRELYKKYFEPLKILANAYHISLGVMSIKAETGKQIELHLKDQQSPYYLGKEYEHVLDYPANTDVEKERFNRLSNDDHSWNYLYGALYIKQLLTQWNKAGYDLSNRPEIVSTLFNVGFAQSEPNSHPKVGGSSVTIGDTTYSFGRLAFEFYYSGELQQEFPLTEKMF